MRILVTGSTGLLGSAVSALLGSSGADVRALARPSADTSFLVGRGIEIVRGDLLDSTSIGDAVRDVDAVVHAAAAILERDEEQVRRVNVDGTSTLLDAVRRRGSGVRRLVFTSSIAAGGFGTSQHPLREDMIPRPATTYGRTKLEAEELVREHARRFPVTILRLSTLYGPRDRFFPALYRISASGLSFLPEGGDLEISLMYVEDAARAVQLALQEPQIDRDTFYVAPPAAIRWRGLANAIRVAQGRRMSIPVSVPGSVLKWSERALERLASAPRPIARRIPKGVCADVARLLTGRGLVCDGTLFEEWTGFETRVTLAEGLRLSLAG